MNSPSPEHNHWLVFSDMDGTLLNHDDYRFDAASTMLRQLETSKVPVIFNTSKTRAEMLRLRQRLDNHHPFIIENGSAIIIPEDYFPAEVLTPVAGRLNQTSEQQTVVMGQPLQRLHEFIDHIAPSAIDFTRCSLQTAIELTGLSETDARLAQSREYSIPLVFSNSDDESEFIATARQAGFRTLRGGRFLHLLGNCDKGQALLQLKRLYQQVLPGNIVVLALGDSPNDLDMLNQADSAIVVESPSSANLRPSHSNCYRTHQVAPQGWVEGIEASLPRSIHSHAKPQEKSHG